MKMDRRTVLMMLMLAVLARANQPPRFDGVSGGEIVLKLKEGPATPVGTVIYRIQGKDSDEGDVLQFGLQGQAANELLRVQPVGDHEADLILIKELDREAEEEYELVITLTDGRIGAGQVIKQSLLIVVEDVNDNAPVFQPFANTFMLKENSAPAVILTVEATDRDQGVYGQVVYSLQADGEDGDEEEIPFSITTVSGKGVIRSTSSLDYEQRSWYQLKILAKDQSGTGGTINTATAGLLVRLVDEEDQGPEFITVPSITRIAEDARPGTQVLRVKAIDGDRGVNQRIVYSFESANEYFAIDPKDGIVYLIQELDREDPSVVNGALILTITAEEDSTLRPKVSTEVTVLVLDVNDQAPAFRGQQYIAEIDENSPANMPVTFVGAGSLAEVYDYDQGKNGTFTLSLECSHDLFEISPNLVVNEAVFSIRVKNHLALDYEELTGTNCTITAKEIVSKQAKSTSVPISIQIRDVNDNIPQFSRPSYQAKVKENAPVGTVIGSVQATDGDSGELGTKGILYSLLAGSIAQALVIDPLNGTISIGPGSSGVLDREKVSQLIVMIEARDSLGTGNRNTVQFTLELEDVNDNAPVYIQSHLEIYINENESSFPYRFRVEAFDHDLNGSANSQIQYSIIDGDDHGNFTIDETTGEIGVVRPLDFELLDPSIMDSRGLGHVRPINLTVRAADMGTPSLFTDTQVLIYVHDVNDYAPVFSRPSYAVTVAEDVPAESSILQVEAIDLDGSGPNNVVAYRIQKGARDKFVIDSATGIISIASGATLDPDQSHPRVSRYQLEILALDGGVGNHQLTATVNVIVSVSDVNNKAPIILDPGTVRVHENVPMGLILTHIVADDPDERPNLRYWIDHEAGEARNEKGFVVRDENVTSWFEINTTDGRIRVIHQLDREKAETVRLALRVEDVAASTPGQTASGTLTVVVEDINDHDPVFNQPFYRRSVPENSKRGTPILTLSADDADLNRTITYSLDGPMELIELIHLNAETGEIVVSGKIDRERFSWINLTAKASDSGVPRRSTLAPVFIQVLDENDNNPQFAHLVGNLSVRENSSPGTVIGTILAHDSDTGDFGEVTYLMDRRSSKGRFSVDPQTGAILVTERLDREEQQSYTLILEAWDNYRVGYAAGESRNAFQTVTVIVTDENDQPPVFELRSGCVEVTEFHDSRVPLTTIHGSDGDDPATPNGQIQFSIEEGNDLGLFGLVNIDSMSTKLFAVKPLVGHHGNYTLKVRAQDRGAPVNTAYQDVDICVSDFNDHAPVFVRPELNNTAFRVFENATVGSVITTLLASDEDAGLNSLVRYSIRPVGQWKWFQVDNVTGELTLIQPLDREKQKVLQIRVEARDSGVPTFLSTDMDLTIFVRDVNDHPAHFEMDSFQINVTEHDKLRQPIRLPDTVDLDEMDELTSANKDYTVCYFIVGGNSLEAFAVDPIHHTLMIEKELDREEQAVHIIVVKATEQCGQIPEMMDFFDPSDDSLLKIVVNVNDINDNPPVFTKRAFTGGVTTETDFGAEVLRVTAVDKDSEDRNARLTYQLRQRVQTTLFTPAEQEGVMLANPFVIDRESGAISLNFDPQRDMKGYFDLEVTVSDPGGFEDTAKVFIYLLRQDQRVKFVLRQHAQYLRARIEQFREVLGNITKSIVNVDDLKAHSNGDGQIDKTKTDLYLHFVNQDDNSVLEVETVLRLIDSNVESLDELFKDYNVLDTSAADPVGRNMLSNSPQQFSLLWASGTAVFLAMILFLVLGLCVSQRFVLMRKLKAASATAFGSQSNVTRTSSQVPNTNQHTVEGSNPVWRQEMEPDWFKHEDIYRSGESDGLDSLDHNAIIANNPPSTSRNSSAANTASLKSSTTTTEAFNRGMLQRNVLTLRSTIGSLDADSSTISEKECEVGEVKEDEGLGGRVAGGLYQRNVYHFGYPVFQPDKQQQLSTSTTSSSNSTTFLSPKKLETTEL